MLSGRHTDPKPNGTAKIKTDLVLNTAAVATIIELEVLVVLREWYRAKKAKDIVRIRKESLEEGRQEGNREGHQRGYKEGFEAGRKAERESQAVSSSNSSEKNEKL